MLTKNPTFVNSWGIHFNPEKCLRNNPVLRCRSECTLCRDSCPENAVTPQQFVIENNKCTACRICITSCPTKAIEDGRLFQESYVRALRNCTAGGTFRISCEKTKVLATRDRVFDYRIRCLHSFNWELLLLPLLRGAKTVHLARERCAGCTHNCSENFPIDRSVETARTVASILMPDSIKEIVFSTSDHEHTDRKHKKSPKEFVSPGFSRRDAFSLLFRLGSNTSPRQDAPARLPENDANSLPLRDSSNWIRELLVEALSKQNLMNLKMPNVPGTGRPVVSPDRCDLCGICVSACPANALQLGKGDDNRATLMLDAAFCTGCGACSVSCDQSAMIVEDVVRIREWCAQWTTIMKEPPRLCRICGGQNVLQGVGICPQCSRERKDILPAEQHAHCSA